jgi:hypothetical protein
MCDPVLVAPDGIRYQKVNVKSASCHFKSSVYEHDKNCVLAPTNVLALPTLPATESTVLLEVKLLPRRVQSSAVTFPDVAVSFIGTYATNPTRKAEYLPVARGRISL